jgi:hypothetical protein
MYLHLKFFLIVKINMMLDLNLLDLPQVLSQIRLKNHVTPLRHGYHHSAIQK